MFLHLLFLLCFWLPSTTSTTTTAATTTATTTTTTTTKTATTLRGGNLKNKKSWRGAPPNALGVSEFVVSSVFFVAFSSSSSSNSNSNSNNNNNNNNCTQGGEKKQKNAEFTCARLKKIGATEKKMVSCVHKKRWGLRFTFFGRLRFIKVFGHKFIKFWDIMLIFFGVLGSQKSVGA